MITVGMLIAALKQHPEDNEVLLVDKASDPDDSQTFQIAHVQGFKLGDEQTYIILKDY